MTEIDRELVAAGRRALAEWRTDRARAVVEAWAEARRALDPRPPD